MGQSSISNFTEIMHYSFRQPCAAGCWWKFFQELVLTKANSIKTHSQCSLGDDVSQIGKGKTVAASGFMPMFGGFFSCAL